MVASKASEGEAAAERYITRAARVAAWGEWGGGAENSGVRGQRKEEERRWRG
jgi:hypothetical protein